MFELIASQLSCLTRLSIAAVRELVNSFIEVLVINRGRVVGMGLTKQGECGVICMFLKIGSYIFLHFFKML